MKKTDICLQCSEEYTPTRRRVQKFCCNSCRSLHWRDRQSEKELVNNNLPVKSKSDQSTFEAIKQEKLSLAGVGNAALGTAAVDLIKGAFTPFENKPATKKDVAEIKALIKGRYLPVNNAGKDTFGRSPYYDVETGNIVHM